MNREVIGLHELEAIVGESGLKTAALTLVRDPFLGEWNYTIKPQPT